jgi:hypothetical protein
MRDLPTPNPRFTGLFIPAEILAIEELNANDCMLLAWIDALQCEKMGGCYASNDYFAQKLRLKNNTISQMITKLKDLNLIKQISYDGRIRILGCCKENWFKKIPIQSQSECDLNHSLTVSKITVSPYIDSKEDIKDSNTGGVSVVDPPVSSALPEHKPPIPKPVALKKEKHLDCVMLTSEEFAKLLALYGKEILDWLLEELNTYVGASGKKYASHYHVLQKRGWVYKRYLESKASVKNGYQRSGKLAIEADKLVQPTERERFKVTLTQAEIEAYEAKSKKAREK